MSVKVSFVLSKDQYDFARTMVEKGAYGSLNEVLPDGLDLLRGEDASRFNERRALRAILDERRRGSFIDLDESNRRIEALIERKKADRKIED